MTPRPGRTRRPRYSIVVPCHNESHSIRGILEGAREAFPEAEVLVVDDGSTDGTAELAAAVDGVRVIRRPQNGGKGLALRLGIQEAAGDVLVFIDGDGQDSPADIHRLLEELESAPDLSLVNGSKFIGGCEEGAISLPNYWGNRFMSGLINLLFGASVSDSQSGFRAIKAGLARAMPLTSTQYEIETEMLCKAIKAGAEVREIPVVRRARAGGTTGFRRVHNGLRILRMIIRERISR